MSVGSFSIVTDAVAVRWFRHCRCGWLGVDYQRELRVVRPALGRRHDPRRLAAASFRSRRRQDWPDGVEQHDTGGVPDAGRTARERAPHHLAQHSAVSRRRPPLRDNGAPLFSIQDKVWSYSNHRCTWCFKYSSVAVSLGPLKGRDHP